MPKSRRGGTNSLKESNRGELKNSTISGPAQTSVELGQRGPVSADTTEPENKMKENMKVVLAQLTSIKSNNEVDKPTIEKIEKLVEEAQATLNTGLKKKPGILASLFGSSGGSRRRKSKKHKSKKRKSIRRKKGFV
jgi:hypothetical protein